jgi:putative PIN family toxin of toxin-antitoxin system
MRIVLDTNVLIASLISRGKCYALVEHSLKVHEIISSTFILNELSEKLQKKFKYDTNEITEALSIFQAKMEIVKPSNIRATSMSRYR